MKLTVALARLAVVALPVAGLVATATPASAQRPRQGTTPAACDVYHSDTGATTQVPEGTRIGLMYCGADGEWHFGWLVDGLVSQPPKSPVKSGAAVAATRTAIAP